MLHIQFVLNFFQSSSSLDSQQICKIYHFQVFGSMWRLTSPKNLVLVGRKGNGKSATGNSIFGTNIFRSERSSSGVTNIAELKTTKLEGGLTLNVIDTPGLIDSSVENEYVAEEIIKCMDMARDGVHAFLVVFSVRSRFSKEEKAAISSLVTLFGRKLYDYMILVFTGGDVLDKDDETLEEFLRDCPDMLKETLCLCQNRCVLFDNKTKDQTKIANQVCELLSFVSMVSRKNGGKPYSSEIFTEFKQQEEIFQALREQKQYSEPEISVLKDEIHEEQFKRITELIEPKYKETTLGFERQLAEERAARVKAEEDAKSAKMKSDEEKHHMKVKLQEIGKRRPEGPESRVYLPGHQGGSRPGGGNTCAIL